MEGKIVEMINIAEVKRRLNLERPDIAALGDAANHRVNYAIGDIRMAWQLIQEQAIEIARLKDENVQLRRKNA